MAAPKENKNAERWNSETVIETLNKMIVFLEENNSLYTLTSALIEFNLYNQWWSEMTIKFKENPVVSETIKRIESIIESRIINDTMVGDAKSAAFSIFLLKNKFGYVDKVETENSHSISGVKLDDMIKFDD